VVLPRECSVGNVFVQLENMFMEATRKVEVTIKAQNTSHICLGKTDYVLRNVCVCV
jgi:hypothetical protein